ncbi:NSF attachment protein [Trema orientale]|uniref:NSF attachment protein n=1 Tax=Trema orientale TaxID=63057 RepID=A0A2P5BN82_TREOI|nr:NSF attachment protein [Trema orientale]
MAEMSVNSNLLKHANTDALEVYQDLNPTFWVTWKYNLLAGNMWKVVALGKVSEMGVYVSLLEYNNSIILFSELFCRSIHTIISLVNVGRIEPVIVLMVDKGKGYIDLSKRTFNEEDIQAEERYNKSNVMRHIDETLGIDFEEIAGFYESEKNIEMAIKFFEKAADAFQNEKLTTSVNQCKQKVAQFVAQLERYQKSIGSYKEIARHSLDKNLLKYEVKGHFLNAVICQLCRGNVVAITSALERYQDLDPTISGTREYKFLADIAASVDEDYISKFTDVVEEFGTMTSLEIAGLYNSEHNIEEAIEFFEKAADSANQCNQMVANCCSTGTRKTLQFTDVHGITAVQDLRKTSLLLKVKENLKAEELEQEDDLT